MTIADNQLAVLNRKIDQIAATCERINGVNRANAAKTLDRLVDRVVAKCRQIARLEQRRELAECDPESPGSRRRTPAIRKTMTDPAGAQGFSTKAITVFRHGGEAALRRFAEGVRAAGHLE